MKHADVAVALLNGFGAETDGGGQQDIDDKRRKKKLMSLRIGCNRQKSSAALSQREEAQERMKNRIEKYQDEVKRRSAARYGKDPNSTDVNYEMQDLKAMVSATMQAVSEERRRARSLKVGGGDAARILAKERQNRSECDMDDDSVSETIKPGEASLVASFSCLHPSIDGVDSILRAGVATAACALATQERIALHSLMACYHLATLYRDGFRYGKNMWPVELFMYQIVESAGYIASCTPRPRLPPSRSYRPSESMFDPACIFFTVAQAATHLAAMAIGVNYGRRLERVDTLSKVSLISLAEGSRDRKISKLLGALADRQNVDDQIDETMSIFRRPQFRANYETNVVFIFSILQSAVASLTNHRGKPFHRSILESRELCFAACATLLFSTVCIAENFPFINGLLELRPMPSRKSKFIILSIAMVDVLVCIICRIFSEIPLKRYATAPKVNSESDVAADLEEKLLEEESKQNLRGVFMVFGLLAFLVLEIFSKD